MEHAIERYEEKIFYTLLIDAIGLANEAKDHDHELAQRMLSRASILTCATLLECCANICIASRSATGTPVDKLARHAQDAHGKTLDAARPEVAAVEELRKIRNDYVHVKTREHPVLSPEGAASGEFEVHPESKTILGLSASPALWQPGDAVRVLQAVENFLRYYFVELLAQTPKQLFELLAIRIHGKGGMSGHMAESLLERALAAGLHNLGVDFRFLGSQSAIGQSAADADNGTHVIRPKAWGNNASGN